MMGRFYYLQRYDHGKRQSTLFGVQRQSRCVHKEFYADIQQRGKRNFIFIKSKALLFVRVLLVFYGKFSYFYDPLFICNVVSFVFIKVYAFVCFCETTDYLCFIILCAKHWKV